MPWSGSAGSQTFSRSNGTNSGATTWAQDEAAAVGITTARHDIHDEDIADSLNLALKKDGGNTATADIPMGGFKFTNLGDATGAANAATLGQVQTLVRDRSVRCATTANITIASALNNGDTIDGITLATDDLVLVKDQSAPAENGVYRVAASPARDGNWDAWNDYPGALIAVHEGTAGADTLWLCTANRGGTLESTSLTFTAKAAISSTITLNFIVDAAGGVIQTGVAGDVGPFDFAGTISAVTLLADQSGSIVFDIWKDSYANFPPTVADTITASAKPTISTATKSQDTTLTGWTTAIAVGDILRFNVDSVTTITRVTLALKIVRTS